LNASLLPKLRYPHDRRAKTTLRSVLSGCFAQCGRATCVCRYFLITGGRAASNVWLFRGRGFQEPALLGYFCRS
jgi:hypothetical protein